jgi:choline dehydrogenase
VLAARLSENPARRVLLVEAGPDFPPPASWPRAITHGNTFEVGDYLTVFQAKLGANQDVMFVPRGEVVGGSGAVNSGVFLRGIAEDYDSWGSALWSYESLLPFFRKQEADRDFPASPIHGSAGPIPVQRQAMDRWLRHQVAFYGAVVGLGLPEKADLAASPGEGIGAIPMNKVSGFRTSAAIGYLDPVRTRSNLTVLSQTRARRFLIEKDRAVGVEIEDHGHVRKVGADLVVAAAGALATPHLLALSGLGPARTLRPLGVPVVVDLPGVGQGLRDHPLVSVRAATPGHYLPEATDPALQTMLVVSSRGGTSRNDFQIMPTFVFEGELLYHAILQAPVSVGDLEIVSADPNVKPKINFRYLESELDRSRFREAVGLIIDMLAQPELAEIGRARTEPSDQDLAGAARLDAWVAHAVATAMHSTGTCRIGAPTDPMAVVDERGRVNGVSNLVVADLSIAPRLPRAPANATAIVIGERMADLIGAA